MRGFLIMVALSLAGMVGVSRADYGVLGTANGYGEFILGDSTRSNVDVQGKIAVGGNALFNNLTVASQQANGAGVNLVVGGTLTSTGATTHGSVVAGGAVDYEQPTILGNLTGLTSVTIDKTSFGGTVSSPGNVTYGTTFSNGNPAQFNNGATISGTMTQAVSILPINFATEATFLKSLSAAQVSVSDPSLAIYPSSGALANVEFYEQYNQIFVNETVKGNYFFNLTGAQLALATAGFVFNAPAGSTIVLNVSGTGFTIPNTGTTYNGGFAVDHLLYNFTNATNFTLAGSAHGTFLAPYATINTTNGGFNGNLIANSLNGSIESHIFDFGGGANTLFSGNLRLRPVPEPGSILLLSIGGLGGLMIRRRMRRAI